MTIATETRSTYHDEASTALNAASSLSIGASLNKGVVADKLGAGKVYLIPFLLVFYADWVGYEPTTPMKSPRKIYRESCTASFKN
jgi:hypothetical protein